MHKRFIASERFADFLMSIVDRFINFLGLPASEEAHTIVYLIFVIALAVISGCIIRWFIVAVVKRILDRRFPGFSHELAENNVLRNCGKLIPPLVLLSLIPFAFNSEHRDTHIFILLTLSYTIVMFVIAINSVIGLVWGHYNTHHNDKNLPLKGILDITRGAMWTIAVIVIISLFADKSPWALLTGLGAFAAVLMLIFKNVILGFVAGIEVSENDMLRVGDWISVPGTDVNGIVIDMSLVVVKVRNWNNTVSMLPPYTLISSHYVNWRYMKDGGSRQILMSVPIDINTVRPLSDDELNKIAKTLPLLKDYITVKLQQRAEGKIRNVFNKEAGVDGTIDTNLGLLRAYVNLFLRQHPYVYTERMCMVRILQPTPTGFPLQVFAYATTSEWPEYEAIMAEIFEHITAVAPTFSLAVYEQPSGRSIFNIAQNTPSEAPYTGTGHIYSASPDPSTNTTPGMK